MSKHTEVIEVSLSGKVAGKLAITSHSLCAFEYDPEFLKSGQSLDFDLFKFAAINYKKVIAKIASSGYKYSITPKGY